MSQVPKDSAFKVLDKPAAAAEAAQRGVPADDTAPVAVELSTERFRWRCLQDYVWLLAGQAAPDWTNLRAEPAAELAKRNGPREVWRIRVGTNDIYAKLYRPARLADRLRALLRGPASRREWSAGRYAVQAGLVAPVPLACGWGRGLRGLGRGALLTSALRETMPLSDYWAKVASGQDARQRYQEGRTLCEALAEVLARAHQSGLRHVDLHVGNLLVRTAPDGRPEIALVDLQSAKVSRPLGDRAILTNLVQLNQWFRRHATRTERLRFLRRYLAWRDQLMHLPHARRIRLSRRRMMARLERMARRHARRLWAKRDRTTLRSGRYFSRIRIRGGWRGHVLLQARRPAPGLRVRDASFTRAQWRAWLDDPLAWVDPRRQAVIKASHSGMICRGELALDDGPMEVICKRSVPRTIWKRFYYLFSRSRNFRTWTRGYALLNRDLPTARPLAVLERRVGGLLLDSMVITEAVRDGHDLDTMLRLYLAPQPRCVQRRVKSQLAARLAGLLRQMHERGFVHRDLKASNLLVQWSPCRQEAVGLALVDLDGLRLRRRVRPQDALGALVRLNVSLDLCSSMTLTDRLRFLKAYLPAAGRSDGQWKATWHRLQELSARKRQQKGRRFQWKLRHYGRP